VNQQDKSSIRGSVRRRLLATLLGGVAVVWLGAAALTAWETRAEMQELLDAHLAQSASLLAAQIGHEFDEVELEHAQPLHKYAHNVVFQIWAEGRILMLHSADAPAVRLSAKDEGFSDIELDGHAWRVFSLWDAQREYLVQVGEAADAREHLAREILEKLVQPLLVSLPLLGLLIWFAVGASLKPVDRIGAALARRDPKYLAPIEDEVPKEIAPMVNRLNGLLERVRSSLESERRFTSDAAHELRTPLAALKTQLQVAQGAADSREREQAISNAIEAGDRATRLVEQLLTLARLEHDAWQRQGEPVDLHQLAAQVLAEAAPLAAEKQIALSLEGEPWPVIQGHAGLLAILLRNLIDNALRYSPAQTAVSVCVSRETDTVVLEVRDQGPGIPAAAREQVLRRFHRLEGAEAGGSGLGLSIAARIAQLHGARLELSDAAEGRGLRVRLCFETGAGALRPPEDLSAR
jgi:two-component system sensor histidine kinase QseC